METAGKKTKSSKKRHTHAHKSHDERGAAEDTASRTAAANTANAEEDWDANRERVEALCAEFPNNVCNDCNESGTRWAAVNFGVFICIRCAGVHRSLGTHVSKVKSTNMDKWSRSEVALMAAVGNTRGKVLYESELSSSRATTAPLSSSEPDDVVRRFIQRKYVDWEFAADKSAKLLRRLQKQAGYGVATSTAPAAEHPADTNAEGTTTDARPSAEDTRVQRQRLLQGLYGQESLTQRQSVRGTTAVDASDDGKPAEMSSTAKTIYGSFGVVNVPSDEYDTRLHALLTAFGCAVPPATAAAAPEGSSAGGCAEASVSDAVAAAASVVTAPRPVSELSASAQP